MVYVDQTPKENESVATSALTFYSHKHYPATMLGPIQPLSVIPVGTEFDAWSIIGSCEFHSCFIFDIHKLLDNYASRIAFC